ncbi:MAG: hypothetical protein JAZ17_04515 [Candidatus Thiodiazotropha endolucinida]|nr:hypothetical protein [Candidatus Thiodiazotropha endolucinida]
MGKNMIYLQFSRFSLDWLMASKAVMETREWADMDTLPFLARHQSGD